jgi:hypothetical protein
LYSIISAHSIFTAHDLVHWPGEPYLTTKQTALAKQDSDGLARRNPRGPS